MGHKGKTADLRLRGGKHASSPHKPGVDRHCLIRRLCPALCWPLGRSGQDRPCFWQLELPVLAPTSVMGSEREMGNGDSAGRSDTGGGYRSPNGPNLAGAGVEAQDSGGGREATAAAKA